MRICEKDILNALKKKHEKLEDIFATQVKIGPMGNKIIDAVAIKKKWSPKTVINYEVKISRSDFLKDEKYPIYIENCNIFYFVTPRDIIKKEELPTNAGLMIYNPITKTKLKTIVKAPYRDVIVNPDILLHVMFWKFNRYLGYRTKSEILEDYKASKELKDKGKEIAIKIWDLRGEIDSLNYEKNSLNRRLDDYRNKIHSLEGKLSKIPQYNEDDLKSIENKIDTMYKITQELKLKIR